MNRARLRTILKSKITENYFFYSLDYGLRIVVQLGYFAIISRSLGAAGYGIFASISAISILAAVFSGLGSEQVLVRRAAGEPAAFPDAFGHTLICIACSIVPVSAICFLVLQFMNTGGIAWWAVVLFVMSETLFTKLTYLANACFMVHEVAGRQFVINITVSSVKLAGAALAWTLSSPLTLEAWSGWYFASLGVGAAFAMALVLWELGAPRFTFYSGDLRDGLQYALEFASVVALRDLDKPLVVETLGAEAGGLYTAAFRVVDSAFIPIRALLLATYTRYFSHAKVDTRAAVAFGYRILLPGLAVSAFLGVCLFAFAWTIPHIIGPSLRRRGANHQMVRGLSGDHSSIRRRHGSAAFRRSARCAAADHHFVHCDVSAALLGWRLSWRRDRRHDRPQHKPALAGGDHMADHLPPSAQKPSGGLTGVALAPAFARKRRRRVFLMPVP